MKDEGALGGAETAITEIGTKSSTFSRHSNSASSSQVSVVLVLFIPFELVVFFAAKTEYFFSFQ